MATNRTTSLEAKAVAACVALTTDPEYAAWSQDGLIKLAYLNGYGDGHGDALRVAADVVFSGGKTA